MAAADRRPVARPAGAVRPLAERVHPPPAVAGGGGVGPGAGRAAGGGRRPGGAGLVAAPPRRDDDLGAPPCRGGEQGGGDRALGRSRGGWGTTLHLRAERGGKPLGWTLMAGQRHEATQVAARLAGGAVARPGGGVRGAGPTGSPATRPTPGGRSGPRGAAAASARSSRASAPSRAAGALRPRRRPPAQRGGAHHRPPQAPPRHRHPLREAGGVLPRPAHLRRHPALAARLKTRLVECQP